MADIIPLDAKQNLTKDQKADLARKSKFVAMLRTLQCTQCSSKCEKCGRLINRKAPEMQTDEKNSMRIKRIPYRFCESCAVDYLDYIDSLQGEGDPECIWQNDDWRDVWQKWISYQAVIDRFMRSEEFNAFSKEMQQVDPDE